VTTLGRQDATLPVMPAATLCPAHRTVLDGFAAYEQAVAGLAAATRRNHRIYLEAFARWWSVHRPEVELARAAPADLSAFLIAEAERGLSARTRRAELAALRRCYAWLVLTGECASNPAAALATPRVSAPRTGVYSAEEVDLILAHTAALTDLRGRQRHVIVATLRYTGMRSQELRTLRRDDLDLPGGRARVVGKGSRERIVLLPPALGPLLTAFLAEVRPLLPPSPLLLANAHPFVTTPLSGFGQEALAREVELAGLGAGVPGRHHPHKWRHTYATELVRGGVDIHVVQRLLGHTSIVSTVAYTHLALDDLRGALTGVWG
jgi:integrase/recombinase XerD